MDEPKPLYNALQVYRERGAFLRRLEQFDNAKVAYDEAYNVCPDDVRLLMGRSQVCSDAVRPAQAFADAELALKYEPQNMIARNMQARALYTLSEFERSVVMNYRGARIRKQPPYFLEGISQGLETLQDCVGVNSGHILLEFLPIIKRNEDLKVDDNEPNKKRRISRMPRLRPIKKLTQMEAHRHETLATVLAMKYLGPMAYDKFFLRELSEDISIRSANAKGSLKLKEIIDEALKTVTERQEMLRGQRPYYSVKLAEKSHSRYQDRFKEQSLQKEREIGARTAESYLSAIQTSLSQLRIKDLIATAERMQLFLDTKTPRTLPDKDMYLDKLYRLVGEGYLAQYRLSYQLSERGNRRRIAFLMGLPVGRPSSYDSVRANYPYKFDDVKLATAKLLETLDMCENTTMKCCVIHDLARLLNTQKNFVLSKFYAKRCQREAQESGNVAWWLNACFVLMSGEMQQANTNEVRAAAEEAYEFSKKMKDPENVQSFLAKCTEMASESFSVDESKAIQQRERDILKIMDDTTRVETEVLFKRMSTVPGGRHFNVLPTKPEAGNLASERRKYRQRGLTVVPGEEKGIPRPPKSKTLGFQLFEF